MTLKRFLTLAAAALLLLAPAALAENPRVELDTNQGKIVLELDAVNAPLSVVSKLSKCA